MVKRQRRNRAGFPVRDSTNRPPRRMDAVMGSSSLALPDDTVAAIATPFGQGAVAVLRVSGPRALEVVGKLWKGAPLNQPRFVRFGQLCEPSDAEAENEGASPRVLDEVLAVWFKSPASYTGEDVVEISCHGGVLVTRRIYEALLRAGARAALPGEFTQRAFLHGKLDLTQAEAVMDLISARSDRALQAATRQLEGHLGSALRGLREDTLALLANVEAYLDFPDEDIDPDTGAALLARLEGLQLRVKRLLATADQGRLLREGVATALLGVPNVGKSSLLNRLAGFDRALVSDVPGTTRDTVEEYITLRGLPLRLIDTAGLRETQEALEQAGIARSRAALAAADLVLEVADASQPPTARSALETKAPRILVLNKCDLGEHPEWAPVDAVRVSCATGEGLSALADAIERVLTHGESVWGEDLIAINARHQTCLQRAHTALEAARALLASGEPPELTAEELRAAMESLGDVVGHVDAEEVLGVIFARFCIGK